MKTIISKTALVVIILLAFVSITAAQGKYGTVGKIFDKQEADVLFGKVIGSLEINTGQLRAAVAKAKDYVLFTIKNNRVIIRDEKRQPLSDENEFITNDETMYVYSKDKVAELLATATGPKVAVERRANVITISSDSATLEFSTVCPPACWD